MRRRGSRRSRGPRPGESAASSGFDDNTAQPDNPLAAYERQRNLSKQAVAEQVNNDDDPVIVANVIVAAATDSTPKVRYPAGSARQLSAMRRFAPRRIFDKQ